MSREANLWGISLLVVIALQWVVLIGLIRRMLRQGQDVEDLKALANQAQERRMKRILAEDSPSGRSPHSVSPSGLHPRGFNTNHLYRSSSPKNGGSPWNGNDVSGVHPNNATVNNTFSPGTVRGGSPSILVATGASPAGLRPKTGAELAVISAQRRQGRAVNPLPVQSPNSEFHQQSSNQQPHIHGDGAGNGTVDYQDRIQGAFSHINEVERRSVADRQNIQDRLTALESTQGRTAQTDANPSSALTLTQHQPQHQQQLLHNQVDLTTGSLQSPTDYRSRSKAALQMTTSSNFQLSPKPEVGHPASLLHTNLPPLGQSRQAPALPPAAAPGVGPAAAIPVADVLRGDVGGRSTIISAGAPINLEGVPPSTMVCLLVTAPDWVDPVTVAPLSMEPHSLELNPDTKEGGSIQLTRITDVHAAPSTNSAKGAVTACMPVKQLSALVVYPAGPEPKMEHDSTVWYPLRLDPTDGQDKWWEADDADSQASGSPNRTAQVQYESGQATGAAGVVIYFLNEGERASWSKWLQVGNTIPSLPCDVDYPAVPVAPMRNASKEATIMSPESRKHGVTALGFSPEEHTGHNGVRRSTSRSRSMEAPVPPPRHSKQFQSHHSPTPTPTGTYSVRSPLQEQDHNAGFKPHTKFVAGSMSPPRFQNGKAPSSQYSVQQTQSQYTTQHQTNYAPRFGDEDDEDDFGPDETQGGNASSGFNNQSAAPAEDYSAWTQHSNRDETTEAPAPFDGFKVTSVASSFPTTLTGFDEVDEDEAAQHVSLWDGRVSIPRSPSTH